MESNFRYCQVRSNQDCLQCYELHLRRTNTMKKTIKVKKAKLVICSKEKVCITSVKRHIKKQCKVRTKSKQRVSNELCAIIQHNLPFKIHENLKCQILADFYNK